MVPRRKKVNNYNKIGLKKHVKKKTNRLIIAQENVLNANKLKDPLKPFSSSAMFNNNGLNFHFECKRICDIDHDTLDTLLIIEEKNMKQLYSECNWGWDFEKKKTEMTDKMAWYLIAKNCSNEIVGFSHFRFDIDYKYPVLYCYELQIKESVRGMGLGKWFMNLLEKIAFYNKMEKVVLTVFKHNTVACEFFTSLKYTKDITSPEDDDERCCYLILSKLDTNNSLGP
ncbi:N-alpha-acetyltransferase 40 isoform X2 [Lycorma delicatula]|uniref:N-alpha-acetyltransferase 40 isoform X2 n=1 Tax=Lycorma delicatula TaxID=130591 RepID=UPI003F5141D3